MLPVYIPESPGELEFTLQGSPASWQNLCLLVFRDIQLFADFLGQ